MNALQNVALVSGAATASDIRDQIQHIQRVMRDVMIEGVHFGKVPGTPKPSLWKPGAEVLCAVFHISPTFRTEAERTADAIRFSVVCVGTHQATGVLLGEGVGECSTDEAKFKWRAPVCPQEYADTSELRRRLKWYRAANGGEQQQQVRTEPADSSNTVWKMAAKRAQVAMVLNVLAASDIFSQDLEDLPEGALDDGTGRTQTQRAGRTQTRAPKSNKAPEQSAIATQPQQKLIRVKLDQAGISAQECCDQFSIESLAELPFAAVNDVLAWITKHAAEAPQT